MTDLTQRARDVAAARSSTRFVLASNAVNSTLPAAAIFPELYPCDK